MINSKAVRRALSFGMGALGLAVPSLASAAMSVVVTSPAANKVVEGSVAPVVRVTSDFTVSSVVARIGPQTTTLAPSGTSYTGGVPLTGVPNGPITLEVTATDVFGATAVGTLPLVKDVSPRLTITAPTSGTVGRPNLRVDVACEARGLYPCTKISVYTAPATADFSAGVPTTAKLVTTASTATLVGDFPLPDGTGGLACFVVETSVGLRDYGCRPIFIDASPRLVPELVLPGPILEVDATRILYSVDRPCATYSRDPCSEYHLRERATGLDTLLPEPLVEIAPRRGESFAHLTPLGAVGSTEWRAGTGTLHPFVPAGYAVAGGDNVAWRTNNQGTWYRNIVTGAEGHYPLAPPAGSIVDAYGLAIADNGDIVFAFRRVSFGEPVEGGVYRVRGGVRTHMASIPGRIYELKTDGVNVVGIPELTDGRAMKLFVIDAAGVETTLVSASSSYTRPTVAVAAGKVAFTRGMGLPGSAVFLRRPSGVIENVAPWNTGVSMVEAIDSGERVMHIHGDAQPLSRYETLPGMGTARVSSPLGRPVSLGGVWYVVMGTTLFRIVDDPTTAGDAGAPVDAGADGASPSDGGAGGDGGSTGDAGSIADAGGPDGGPRDSATTPGSGGGGGAPSEPSPGDPLSPGGGGGASLGDAESGGCSVHGAVGGSLVPAAFALGLVALARRRRRRE